MTINNNPSHIEALAIEQALHPWRLFLVQYKDDDAVGT
jgi:hypothetical protein